MRQPYTKRQFDYAVVISCALEDNANLQNMDKWEMRDYISRSLSDPEKNRKINEYKKMLARDYNTSKREKNRFNKPWLTDESLGGEWGLDASDFGAQSWGNS